MPFIKITRQTFLSSEPAFVGEIYEVDEDTARQTIAHNKAVLVDPPADAVQEPPKPPKAKKVTAPKDKADQE